VNWPWTLFRLQGELAMDFVPLATEECDLCSSRRAEGQRPFCAQICPTRALTLRKEEDILGLLRRNDRFHICKMGASGDI
jgi:Fe-S-cluster-containing dehydrogenase component